MQEFENLTYMPHQKAATTSIIELLRIIVDENEKQSEYGRHRPAEKGHDIEKFHFISVRNPLSMYISLFGHGCSKRGGMYKKMSRRGLDHFYDPTPSGFHRWLAFITDDDNINLLGKKKYALLGGHLNLGILTSRLLRLSILDPVQTLHGQQLEDRVSLLDFFNDKRLYTYYVRTESLAEDLFVTLSSCAGRVKFNPPLTTVENLRALLPRKNVGLKIEGLRADAVSEDLRQRVFEREWLFYEVFGYGESSNGKPPPLPPRKASEWT